MRCDVGGVGNILLPVVVGSWGVTADQWVSGTVGRERSSGGSEDGGGLEESDGTILSTLKWWCSEDKGNMITW